ncbi:hypothetical protein C8F04DRAFT_1179196 [Mycena alexandri]|uniref:Uncharacterized protein n=1 Tax=Mycena alexandri TaxID=1745969 RepID=A0AAD6T4U5_9AGAR|nr:hypothetical protein C8F04DRAFT_1179196 [Mycena alexandri]
MSQTASKSPLIDRNSPASEAAPSRLMITVMWAGIVYVTPLMMALKAPQLQLKLRPAKKFGSVASFGHGSNNSLGDLHGHRGVLRVKIVEWAKADPVALTNEGNAKLRSHLAYARERELRDITIKRWYLCFC